MRRSISGLNDGLVGAWCPSVSGAQGFLLPDLSGNGNHGKLTNMDPATDWVTNDGKYGLDFDGTNEWVPVAFPSVDYYPMTISAWIYTRDNSTQKTMVSVISENATGSYLVIQVGFGNILGLSNNGSNQPSISTSISANVWTHIAFSINAGGSRVLYKNGVAAASNGTEFAAGQRLGGMSIGCLRTSATSGTVQFADAMISDVLIHRYAMSGPVIRQLYEGGPGYGLRNERRRSYFVSSPPATRRYPVFRPSVFKAAS